MVVNDVPGEECRIAILRDGRLDDLYAERVATAISVGNIYKGRVTNVEQAIQAAFVDFGHAQKGFLHYSDLHPRYFPAGDKTEKVGKKTSRRERPPLQECPKRGDEILVQVIKGKRPWRYKKAPRVNMYQQEHNELFASIRKGEPINDGEWMMQSTMMSILGRMAAYTGQTITWEQAMNSKERLGPETYSWGEVAMPEVAIPGRHKFV